VRTIFPAAVFILVISGQPVLAQSADRLRESVDRGLAFLLLQQEKDGAWLDNGNPSPAITSLAVMAFLSASHVPGEGPYRANVEKGIRWVLDQQQPSGLFGNYPMLEMYHHGISTLMLAEVVAMSDAKTAREIKPKLEKAVQVILQAQRTGPGVNRGGWRYQVQGHDADMSVTGWQLLALRAARNLGCDVPKERMDLAVSFVQQCRDPRSNGFCYLPGGQVTAACTGTGVLALELCGKERHHSHDALLAGSYLLKNPPRHGDANFHYASYYAAQAMFQLGNNYWTQFRPRLHKELMDNQKPNGGWLTNDIIPRSGVSFATSMAILALTVEYRLLPIYQRDEDADTAKK
jgi:hypothetical protein